jgi:hypothetical protein
MKQFISLGMVVVLSVFVLAVPVRAGDGSNVAQEPATFYALSELAAADQAALAPITDGQLSSIQGAQGVCVICAQAAIVTQTNAALLNVLSAQTNASAVSQSINR